eukprot:COSAG01_NODE_1258_length_11012_cov_18.155136_4_plen_171_part_00
MQAEEEADAGGPPLDFSSASEGRVVMNPASLIDEDDEADEAVGSQTQQRSASPETAIVVEPSRVPETSAKETVADERAAAVQLPFAAEEQRLTEVRERLQSLFGELDGLQGSHHAIIVAPACRLIQGGRYIHTCSPMRWCDRGCNCLQACSPPQGQVWRKWRRRCRRHLS